MQETCVRSLGWEDPLGEGLATHSSIFAWEITWMEESDGLQFVKPKTVGQDSTEHRSYIWAKKKIVSNIGFWVQNKILMIDLGKFYKSSFKWESDQVALISDQLAFLQNGQTYAELNEFSISCLVFTTALCKQKNKKPHIRKIATDQLSRHAQQLEILLKCNWLPILLSTDVKQEDSVQHCTKIIG